MDEKRFLELFPKPESSDKKWKNIEKKKAEEEKENSKKQQKIEKREIEESEQKDKKQKEEFFAHMRMQMQPKELWKLPEESKLRIWKKKRSIRKITIYSTTAAALLILVITLPNVPALLKLSVNSGALESNNNNAIQNEKEEADEPKETINENSSQKQSSDKKLMSDSDSVDNVNDKEENQEKTTSNANYKEQNKEQDKEQNKEQDNSNASDPKENKQQKDKYLEKPSSNIIDDFPIVGVVGNDSFPAEYDETSHTTSSEEVTKITGSLDSSSTMAEDMAPMESSETESTESDTEFVPESAVDSSVNTDDENKEEDAISATNSAFDRSLQWETADNIEDNSLPEEEMEINTVITESAGANDEITKEEMEKELESYPYLYYDQNRDENSWYQTTKKIQSNIEGKELLGTALIFKEKTLILDEDNKNAQHKVYIYGDEQDLSTVFVRFWADGQYWYYIYEQ